MLMIQNPLASFLPAGYNRRTSRTQFFKRIWSSFYKWKSRNEYECEAFNFNKTEPMGQALTDTKSSMGLSSLGSVPDFASSSMFSNQGTDNYHQKYDSAAYDYATMTMTSIDVTSMSG